MQLTFFIYFFFYFLFILFETIQLIRRNYNRKNGYKKALFMSKQTKKPLLVIGSPETGGYNSIFGNNYGCGSICIDIVGCGKCKNQEQVDALEYLKKKPTNYYVIYESCVLEAIDDESKNKKIIDEIKRVSGGDYVNVRVGTSIINYIYLPKIWENGKTNIIKKTLISEY